ncbi:hypothetical protein [Micromonospora chersina]
MTPAKQELRDLIEAKMRARLNEMSIEFFGEDDLADSVMELFYEVADDWDSIDVSTMADGPGGKLLDQRWLVARVPREARHRDMVPDRTVTL